MINANLYLLKIASTKKYILAKKITVKSDEWLIKFYQKLQTFWISNNKKQPKKSLTLFMPVAIITFCY